MVEIDPSKAYQVRKSGDLRIVYTWADGERAMILIPAVRRAAPWYVVCESAAFEWDDESAVAIPRVIAKARKACEVLGMEDTMTNVHRIAQIVIDGLPDLIRMPREPKPENASAVLGQFQFRADGHVLTEQPAKLPLPVATRATYG